MNTGSFGAVYNLSRKVLKGSERRLKGAEAESERKWR
jgi:hypothetical protein